MTDSVVSESKVEQIVERYIQMRDRKAQMKKEYEASVKDIDMAMERVENHLQSLMNTLGVESLRTSHGTAYQTIRTSATVADWEMTLGWIRAHEHWAMLEKRVSKTFVDDYRSEHDDLPPGVNWTEARTVNIKRS